MIRFKSDEQRQGWDAALQEIREDGWTKVTARGYLSTVTTPANDYEAGFDLAVYVYSMQN